MLKSENHIAFKEWASIVGALGEGKQILILRKGGIREESGDFQVEHNEFFLFPTYEHQNKSDLKPETHQYLDEVFKNKPASNQLPIEYYVKVENVFHITNEPELSEIRPFHVWSDEAVAKRFHYGKQKGLYVITSRVYKLPNPQTIQVTPEYAGCKSWVELTQALSVKNAKSVLSDTAFYKQLDSINTSLVKS